MCLLETTTLKSHGKVKPIVEWKITKLDGKVRYYYIGEYCQSQKFSASLLLHLLFKISREQVNLKKAKRTAYQAFPQFKGNFSN